MATEKKTKKTLHNELREKTIGELVQFFTNQDNEVLQVKTNELALPVLDAEGNEEWIVLTVKVPLGSGGEPYDGYQESIDFHNLQKEKAEKSKIAEEKKQRKIENDKKRRAKLKEQQEKEKDEKEKE